MFTFIFDLAVKNLLEITKTFQNKEYIRSIVNHWHRAIGSRPSVPEIRLENLPPPHDLAHWLRKTQNCFYYYFDLGEK